MQAPALVRGGLAGGVQRSFAQVSALDGAGQGARLKSHIGLMNAGPPRHFHDGRGSRRRECHRADDLEPDRRNLAGPGSAPITAASWIRGFRHEVMRSSTS